MGGVYIIIIHAVNQTKYAAMATECRISDLSLCVRNVAWLERCIAANLQQEKYKNHLVATCNFISHGHNHRWNLVHVLKMFLC